eukprot:CAMPEP_0117432250 /NCGR_PEP_ID=MMETSP0758-20121206/11761_1 /TAXON_ID=63605 /ORGANISM="Percolomonas cosmopolitus, Strain AE-1 (ATCC 50343)" /LENGTH=328 /DNA_ID=CAMNT_0005222025 /DNA_START=327 /DNA_END=1309 /DNA_ORIENTATION=+
MANPSGVLEDDWIVGKDRVRGGETSTYSKPVMVSCGTVMTATTSNFTFVPPRRFSPHNLVILTDGTCGSTCGQFIKLMQELKAAKIVNQGLSPSMAIASFKGAAVMFLDAAVQVISASSFFCTINPDLMPSTFKSTAMLTYAWFELYPWTNQMHANDRRLANMERPIGYTRQPADFMLDSLSFEGPESYNELLEHPLWDSCVKSVTYDYITNPGDDCTVPFVPSSIIGVVADLDKVTFDDSIRQFGQFGYPCSSSSSSRVCHLVGCGLNRYVSAIDTPKDPDNPNTLYDRHYSCLESIYPFDPYTSIMHEVVYIILIVGIVSLFLVGS